MTYQAKMNAEQGSIIFIYLFIFFKNRDVTSEILRTRKQVP